MGHVDHGKTTLLDWLRKSNVVAKEAGGITQHLGAFTVKVRDGTMCFLDTPGHAAFKAVRERGATATDIVVLVVALDDGVMPQTREVARIARAKQLPLVVALSKADLFAVGREKRIDGIAKALADELVLLEASPMFGSVQRVLVSGVTGEGVDDLIMVISAEAEMLDDKLLVDPGKPGSGFVLETRQREGIGDVASVLLKNGVVKVGDWVVSGDVYGRVRSISDESGGLWSALQPSVPALIAGWRAAPPAGEEFVVVGSEGEARDWCDLIKSDRAADTRDEHARAVEERTAANKLLLEEYRRRLADRSKRIVKVFDAAEAVDGKPVLSVILKADVVGSLEAIKQAIASIPQSKASIDLVHHGIGPLTLSDVELARVCKNRLVVHFNQPVPKALAKLLKHHNIASQSHNIIYSLTDGVSECLRSLLPKEEREEVLGQATVKQLFQIDARPPQVVAGCSVDSGCLQSGKVGRADERIAFRISRQGVTVFEGPLKSMRHEKKETTKVQAGMECGLLFGFTDLLPGDMVQQIRFCPVEPSL